MSNVAPVAGGVVGGVVGWFVGGPMGAFKGAMIGMALGGALFPPESETEKVKPSKLDIPTAQSGIAVPVIYGSSVISGNIIWYGNFKSTFIDEGGGGKGSGGGKNTQGGGYYTYTASFVMGLCMGPATVLRAWAGKDKIDLSKFRIYTGDQTTPDEMFERLNLPRKPIWKNLCYVVADNYRLGTSSAIPLLTFEVARIGTIDVEGTHYWDGDVLPYKGGLSTNSNKIYVGGGDDSSTARVDIYDPFIFYATSRPGTIPSSIGLITSNDTYVFCTVVTTPKIVYQFLAEDFSYVGTINLTTTASKIMSLDCTDLHLFICYEKQSDLHVVFGVYKCADRVEDTSLKVDTAGISSLRVLCDLAVTEKAFFTVDSANKRIWKVLRASPYTVSSVSTGTRIPTGLDITPTGYIWTVSGGDAIYVYDTDLTFLRTISGSAYFSYASKIKFQVPYNRYVVLDSTSVAGTTAWPVTFSSGLLSEATAEGALRFIRKPQVGGGPINNIETNGHYLTLLIGGTIQPHDFNGKRLYTYSGKTNFTAISQTEDGIYGTDGSGTIYFYPVKQDYTTGWTANTRYIATEIQLGKRVLQAVTGIHAKIINGVRYLWVAWRSTAAVQLDRGWITQYTLTSTGQVSTATYLDTWDMPQMTVNRASRVKATEHALYVLNHDIASVQGGYWTILAYVWDDSNTIGYSTDAKWTHFAYIDNYEMYLTDICPDDDLTSVWAVRMHLGTGEGPQIFRYNYNGKLDFKLKDDVHLYAGSAVLYHNGRLYVGNWDASVPAHYLNTYATEDEIGRWMVDQLPADISTDMLTNDLYGLGLDKSTYIDLDEKRKTDSYCVDKDLLISMVFDRQTSILDALQEVITQHNGFITYRDGKIAHGQLQYNPELDDCSFVQRTDVSDDFADSYIAQCWRIFGEKSVGDPYVSESGGYLNLAALSIANSFTGLESMYSVYGAFDIRAEYSSFSGSSSTSAYGTIGLMFYIDEQNWAYIGRQRNSTTDRYTAKILIDNELESISAYTSSTSGKFQIIRKGREIYLYYETTLLLFNENFSILGGKVRLFNHADTTAVSISAKFDNYILYESPNSIYPENIVRSIGKSSDSDEQKTPATITVRGHKERYNVVTVEYIRRDPDYETESVNRDDPVDVALYGKNPRSLKLDGIRKESRAKLMCDLTLFQSLAQPLGASFGLGWKNLSLRPGDLAWFTDDTLDIYNQPVRIASVSESKEGILEVEVRFEEDIYYADTYVDVKKRPKPIVQPNEEAGLVYDVTIIQPNQALIKSTSYELHIFYSLPIEPDKTGGVSIYKSYASTGSYRKIGQTLVSGLIGYIIDLNPTNPYIDVQLNTKDDLESIDQINSIWENLAAVILIDGSVVWFQYTTVEAYENNTWRITGLTYDADKSAIPNSYGDMDIGNKVLFYRTPYRYVVEQKDIGKTLYFKFPTINPAGEEQSLAVCNYTSAVIGAEFSNEGTPAPQIGDAVHLGSDNKMYRANIFNRRNVIGIKDSDGNIVSSGAAIIAGGSYSGNLYLTTPLGTWLPTTPNPIQTTYSLGRTTDGWWAQYQSFTVSTDRISVGAVLLNVGINADPACSIWCEIRADDGTGKPSSTVLDYTNSLDCDAQSKLVYTSGDNHYFTFSQFPELRTGTTYHLVVRTNKESLSTTYVKISGYTTSGAGYSGYSSTEGLTSWTARATGTGLYHKLYLIDLNSTTGSNITSEHPFENSSQYLFQGGLPVIKIGQAISTSEIFVNLEFLQSKVLYSGGNNEIGALTSTLGKVKTINSNIVCSGVREKILVLWRGRVEIPPDYGASKAIWCGVESSLNYHAGIRFIDPVATAVFSNGLTGVQSLQARIFFTAQGGGGTTTYVNYFTVIGV
jgi:hypothetical protein